MSEKQKALRVWLIANSRWLMVKSKKCIRKNIKLTWVKDDWEIFKLSQI